jgi:hypothetical protein
MRRKRKLQNLARGFTRRPFGTLYRATFRGLAGMDGPQTKATLNLFAVVIALATGLVVGILTGVVGGDALALSVFWRIVVGLVAGVVTTSVTATSFERGRYIRR